MSTPVLFRGNTVCPINKKAIRFELEFLVFLMILTTNWAHRVHIRCTKSKEKFQMNTTSKMLHYLAVLVSSFWHISVTKIPQNKMQWLIQFIRNIQIHMWKENEEKACHFLFGKLLVMKAGRSSTNTIINVTFLFKYILAHTNYWIWEGIIYR